MKTITCFTESLCGGGAEHQMVILAGFLTQEGYDVRIITYASLPDHYDTPEGVIRKDIGKTRVKGRLRAVIKALKVFHYFLWVKTDCIIAYRECANLRVLPPLFFRRRSKLKVICSDRNTSTYITKMHKLLLYVLYRRADFIVPNSKTETDIISSIRPQLKSKLRTIHNYTDLQQFAESKMPDEKEVIKVAIFSRFSEQKNPIGFADAIKELKQKTRHSFEIHWYGEQKGEADAFNIDYLRIKKRIEENKLEVVFILHPAVKNPSMYMGEYHAVCLPSLYEGFSNSVAEGICCAKPMLVSDVSDNSVMVHNGENGFLFDPKQTNSICDAFLRFFELSPEEMREMSKRSRMIAEQLFNKNSFIQHYVDLIENNIG